MGPAAALEEFKRQLKADPGYTSAWLSDPRKIPQANSVQFWYSQHVSKSFAAQTVEELIQKLKERRNWYGDKAIIEVSDTHAVAAVIPLLAQRAHSKPWAGELVLVDGTGSVDRSASTLTGLSAVLPCAKLSIPLGFLVMAGKSGETTTEALRCYQRATARLPVAWGGRGDLGPGIVMSDMELAELNAFHTVWPSALRYVCTKHSMDAVCRNVKTPQKNVPVADRPILEHLFKKCVNVGTVPGFLGAWVQLLEKAKASSVSFYEYLHTQFEQNVPPPMWAKAFRSFKLRGHHTNNFSERAMRTFKDQVLHRIRCYNQVALLDWIVENVDEVYACRLENYSYNRDNNRICDIRRFHKAAQAIPQSDVVCLSPVQYEVQSQARNRPPYYVNAAIGFCDCFVGSTGRACKHMDAVYHTYGKICPNLVRFDQSSRFYAATLARGRGAGVPWSAFVTSGETVAVLGGQPLQPSSSAIRSDSEPEGLDRDYTEDSNRPPPQRPSPATQNQLSELDRLIDLLADNLKIAARKVVTMDGYEEARNDLATLTSQSQNIKTPGQLTQFVRAKLLASKPRGKKTIQANNRARVRRKFHISTSTVVPAGRPRSRSNISSTSRATPKLGKRSSSQISGSNA